MPKFLFHLRSRDEVLMDDEGIDYVSADAAMQACPDIARDLIAEDVKSGAIDLEQWIVITDNAGQVISEYPFVLALEFRHAEDRAAGGRCR
jgi:hypothetical protein